MGITPTMAMEYGIQDLLLSAPKKPRIKYGPRRFQGEDERQYLNRERNREHAKATRIRKKIFREVKKSDSIIMPMYLKLCIICFFFLFVFVLLSNR
jgi:hypothetical protein